MSEEYKPIYGHWEEIHGYVTPGGDPVWCCSECGKGIHVYGIEHTTYGADIADHQWVACPNCGAIMLDEKVNSIIKCHNCKYYGSIKNQGKKYESGKCFAHEEDDYVFNVHSYDFCSSAERR